MLEKRWKTLGGEKIADMPAVLKELAAPGDREFHIGTDSQQCGKHTEFVTVIVALQPGKGGRAFYTRERVQRIASLRERLMREVMASVTLGIEMTSVVPEELELTVHVDANPNTKFKSSSYVQELAGMVVSQGFKALLKPEAWCATHAADHVVKFMLGRQ